jgi:hypothetical protein
MTITTTRAHYMATLAPLAHRFVRAIHDDGPEVASDILDTVYAVPRPPGVVASRALMTILAAMVDPTPGHDMLLDWVRQPPAQRLARLLELRKDTA